MKKKLAFIIVLIFCTLCIASSVRADYVMPYPSYMPGNTLYRVSRIMDRLKFYWSWGNIAQVKYHLALSDKYLIEAKTLMEYKQYLLGTDALARSDKEFMQLPSYVSGAKKEGVNVNVVQQLITSAAEKHTEVLTGLLTATPDQFTWTPEKSKPTELPLAGMIRASVEQRQHIASETASQ